MTDGERDHEKVEDSLLLVTLVTQSCSETEINLITPRITIFRKYLYAFRTQRKAAPLSTSREAELELVGGMDVGEQGECGAAPPLWFWSCSGLSGRFIILLCYQAFL